MRYDRSLMEDLVRWYGLEGQPEFQLEGLRVQQWVASTVHVKLSKAVKQGIKAFNCKRRTTKP